MSTEIELKAHIYDSETLRLLLMEKAEYLGAFEKEDSYWYPQLEGAQDLLPYGLRIRKEKCTSSDGEISVIATYKKKEILDGLEINNEREFKVTSASDFEGFLNLAGMAPKKGKRKRGWAFSYKGITAELTEVESLGWFIELEIITDNKKPETLAESRKQLLEFLEDLGIERKAIESRSYLQMLHAL